MHKPRFMRSAIIFASWSLFAICMALLEYYGQNGSRPVDWGWLVRSEFTYAYLWALLTPLILWMARRFPMAHRGWYRSAPLHAAACIVLICVQKSAFEVLR